MAGPFENVKSTVMDAMKSNAEKPDLEAAAPKIGNQLATYLMDERLVAFVAGGTLGIVAALAFVKYCPRSRDFRLFYNRNRGYDEVDTQ